MIPLIMIIITATMAGVYLCWRSYTHSLARLAGHLRLYRYGRTGFIEKDQYPGSLADLAGEIERLEHALREKDCELDKAQRQMRARMGERTSRLRRKMRKMHQNMYTDTMTGLANRRYYQQYAQMLSEWARKNQKGLACVVIDVDHFKAVNDRWGHPAGDEVLGLLGELIKVFTREGDLRARLGGDEFILMLYDCPREQAQKVGDRIRRHFAREAHRFDPSQKEGRFYKDADPARKVQPRLSVGIAMFQHNQEETLNQLVARADQALYRAKAAGRNQVVVCN